MRSDILKENYSQAVSQALSEIEKLLTAALGPDYDPGLLNIETPKESALADFSVPCFLLAKKLKKSPVQVAAELAGKIQPVLVIKEAKAVGPYLNFFVRPEVYTELVMSEIYKSKEKYGQSKIGKGQKIMVEYFSPNTNKPLTVGHVRNICLGASIVSLLKFSGFKVLTATLYNDRGIAIAKAIAGYLKWGRNKTPKDVKLKPDHFVGRFYTRFCRQEKKDKNLANEAKQILVNWENDKKEIKEVWQKLMLWVLEGFWLTLKKLGVEKYDEEYYESEYYQQGKEVVEKGLKQGVFVRNAEGVIFAPLESYGLPDKIVLRPDSTSLYITQDLHLAYLKDKHKLDSSIYVVGSEQDLYFKQLFKILELLGFKNAAKYHHLSYGMIRLPSGKIKSREGLVKGTGADGLVAELEKMAKTEIMERIEEKLPEDELEKRAEIIALGALKFYILTVNPKTTMVFEPQKSIAFNGRTGPYLQYVYARINSIFAKSEVKVSGKINYSLLSDDLEIALIKHLAKFPQAVSSAVNNYDPSEVANYLFDLAKAFSLFYEKLPINKAEEQTKIARLLLISQVALVLKTGLDLLGIQVPQRM